MHVCSCNNYRISWYVGRACGSSLFEKLDQSRAGILSFKSSSRWNQFRSWWERVFRFRLLLLGPSLLLGRWPLRLAGLPQVPKVSLRSALRKPGNKPIFRVSWMIRTVLSFGGMKGMWCSPSLQILRLTAGRLLSTSSLLISPSATPRMMSLGASNSKKCMR